MNSISVEKICEITGGRVLEDEMSLGLETALNTHVDSVILSSRECMSGSLFVPIIGEKNDAHDFIGNAYENGARVCFTSRMTKAADTQDMVYILVKDTKKALQDLGTFYRNQFNGKVIGITGSVGKTTTKEMVAKALSAGYKVLKTAGNKNSQLGVPIMMLELDNEKYNLATFEMGISDPGEMDRLASIAQPKYAVMTNIGVSHLATLGTRENIRSEKLKITNEFPADGGILFLNGEDEFLCGVRDILPADKKIKVVTFGFSDKCDFYAENIETLEESSRFTFVETATGEREQVFLPVIGKHNVLDAVAAMAVSKYFDIKPCDSAKSLSEYTTPNMRGRIEKFNGITMIDDTYNASPDSMRSGLSMLESIKATGRKIVIFADSLDLGDISEQLHREVGRFTVGKDIDLLITIGKMARFISEEAKNEKAAFATEAFDTKEELLASTLLELSEGDVVYIKGSRGMKLDLVADAIRTKYNK